MGSNFFVRVARQFHGDESVEHSLCIGWTRRDAIQRWMPIRFVNSLSHRNESLAAKQSNSLKLFLVCSFPKSQANLIHLTVHFCPPGRFFKNLYTLGDLAGAEDRTCGDLTLLEDFPTIVY